MLIPHRLMITFGVSILAASLASSQSKPAEAPATRAESSPWMKDPDDRYAKLLAGKKLEDGKGFPGVVVIGDSLGPVVGKLGAGREEMEWLWWYFYDKGGWELTVCCIMETAPFRTTVHALIVGGNGAPATTKGVRIGDPVSKAIGAYGQAQPFNGALVGLAVKGKTRTWHDFASGHTADVTVDDPPEFKDALFFPAAKLLVAVENDRVKKLAIIGDEEMLPELLRPAEKVAPSVHVKLDPSVTVPRADEGKDGGFLVPPPPVLATYKGAGFSAQVPKDWALARSVWTDPKSVESVTIRVVDATTEETPEETLASVIEGLGPANLVPEFQRKVPEDFCRMVGAKAGYCGIAVAEGKGKEGLPLRSFVLLLMKGDRQVLAIVTRTQHPERQELPKGGFRASAFMGCPDGDAFARGVMRSIRITP